MYWTPSMPAGFFLKHRLPVGLYFYLRSSYAVR